MRGKCFFSLAASVGFLAAASSADPATELSPEALGRATAATVYIKVDRIYQNHVIPTGGSGFFVSPQGYLLTNWHVVSPQVEVEID
ncbi:MAG: hypothetical protein MUF10_16785, partial [Thermoanaerobaculaceae bacterium]|nr:hypothetical protein [Thermoanaerobaculaceae bacterium]